MNSAAIIADRVDSSVPLRSLPELANLRVLFVDDEPNLLHGLRRMLHAMRSQWDMQFASSGQEALQVLAKTPFDVIVSDMRMPGMDGIQLLDKVKELYPQIVRFVLSGTADQQTSLRSLAATHQFLNKPCDPETMRAAIARTVQLRRLLDDQSLKRVIARVSTIPSVPSLYCELLQELQSPAASIEKVAQIISRDVGMTAKVLQLVNSSFFGLAQQVSSPAQAVMLLGLSTLQSLVLSLQVFSQFEQNGLKGFGIDRLVNHCLNVGRGAKAIAKTESADTALIEQCLLAGMMHDVGKLLLAANMPDDYRQAILRARGEGRRLIDTERLTFGVTHAEVGAYLLGLWGLPLPIVEAVAYHHTPSAWPGNTFSPLIAVHVANSLAYEGLQANTDSDHAYDEVDLAFLENIDLAQRLDDWRAACHSVESNGEQR